MIKQIKNILGGWKARLAATGAAATLILTATLSSGAPAVPPAAGAPATAGPRNTGIVTEGLDPSGEVKVMAGKSTIITTSHLIKRVNIGQAEVADATVVNANSVVVTGKKPGATQLIVWDDSEKSQVIDVNVLLDVPGLQDQLKVLLPGSHIDANLTNGAVILRGRVPSVTAAEQAIAMAQPYGKVLNFLEVAGGQQVMLQVKFAEVSRSAVTQLGVNGFITGNSFFGGSNIGQVNPLGEIPGAGVSPSINPAVTLFGGGQIGSYNVNIFLNSLRQNNLLRVLAEPNLIAISGQEASFLAGGEFPIPITQGGSGSGTSVTIEFREFGVKLKFVPIVLGDGKIRLKVAPEVSDLDFTTAVKFNGFVVPGLTQRKVATTIELADGQTFAIAGLLNNSVNSTKDVTPLLGDLPVVGALFRSVRYQRKETELLVLVTPRLVEPMNPEQVPGAPGEAWRHPTENELFVKGELGGPAVDPKRSPAGGAPTQSPRFYGPYGFTPVTQPDSK